MSHSVAAPQFDLRIKLECIFYGGVVGCIDDSMQENEGFGELSGLYVSMNAWNPAC